MKLKSKRITVLQAENHGELIIYCENEQNYIETIKTLISKGSEIDDKYNLNNIPKNYPVFLFIRFGIDNERKPIVYDYEGCEGMVGMIIMNELREITHPSRVIISALKSNESLYGLREVMRCGPGYVYQGIRKEIERRQMIPRLIEPFKEHKEAPITKEMGIYCENEQDYIEAVSTLSKYVEDPKCRSYSSWSDIEKQPGFGKGYFYIFFRFIVESSINGYKNRIISYGERNGLGMKYTCCGYGVCIHEPGTVKGVLDANESLYNLCHE